MSLHGLQSQKPFRQIRSPGSLFLLSFNKRALNKIRGYTIVTRGFISKTMAENSFSSERDQIERILHSRAFQGSETLCRLLAFLAEKSLEDPHSVLKEYRIATEVLGRKEDFDPRLDSSVRVQATRLRSKLIEYALTEGAQDPILVELPKGAYRLAFTPVTHAGTPVSEAEGGAGNQAARRMLRSRAGRFLPWILLASGLICGALLASLFFALRSGQIAAPAQTGDPLLRAFWQPYLSDRAERVVVFSNANFVGHPDRGMRYYHPGQDQPADVIDHYTGVGEVLSIHELDRAFDSLGYPIRVRRGALLSMDDVKDSNLIFVGSPVENLVLNDMPALRYFRFQVKAEKPREGEVGVANLHPMRNEDAFYLHAPVRPIVDDYAIVARFRGLEQARTILIAAGTTTIGTQGAVEFLSHPESVKKLLDDLGPGHASDGFEAVIHVKVTKGVPVASEVVAFRKL